MLSVVIYLLSFLLDPGSGSTRVPGWPQTCRSLAAPGGASAAMKGCLGTLISGLGYFPLQGAEKTLLMSLNQRRCVILIDREALRYAAPGWAIQGLGQVSRNVGPSLPHPPWPFGLRCWLVPWSHDHQTSQRRTSRSPPSKRGDPWWGPS